jgi:hypothetical protein
MKNYRRLSLPKIFLKEDISPHIFNFKGGYNLYPFSEILNHSLLNSLKKIPLEEDYVAVFTNNNKETSIDKRMIHSDIKLGEDNRWKEIICGIHYELLDSESEFLWYDMKQVPEILPLSEKDNTRELKFKRLNGIHFDKRGSFGVPKTCELLESVKIEGPLLVRTNVPHTVLYKNPNRNRYSFSLRFKETYNSWEEALEIFKPFF